MINGIFDEKLKKIHMIFFELLPFFKILDAEILHLLYSGMRYRLETSCIGGSPSRKILRFNTIVFRKDKWGIILKVIIRTSKIRVLWGLKVVPIGRNKGR